MIALLALLSTASAHHPSTAVGQVGVSTLSDDGISTAPTAPQLVVGLGWAGRHSSRTLQGSKVAADGFGRLSAHTAALRVGVLLPSATRIQLTLPVAAVHFSGISDAPRVGLGDIDLGVQQIVGSGDGLAVAFSGAVAAPTAGSGAIEGSSVSALDKGDDGSLKMTTYDTRAALGLGSFSASLGAQGQWAVGESAALVGANLRQPFGRTEGGIRWGTDVSVAAGASQHLKGRRVALSGLLDWTSHLPDSGSLSGASEASSTGARQQIGTSIGLRAAPGANTSCSVSVRLPVWQHAQGVQLMPSVEGQAACSWRAEQRRRDTSGS